MCYNSEVMGITYAIREAFGSLGWIVDMIVDYGSHARGEARVDSDYDVNVYVHRPGWLYLFTEYAQRLATPMDKEMMENGKKFRTEFASKGGNYRKSESFIDQGPKSSYMDIHHSPNRLATCSTVLQAV